MMKTVKYILLILLLNCSMLLMATTYQLHQTSTATLHSIGASAASTAGAGYGNSMCGSTGGVTAGGAVSVAAPAVSFHSTSTMSTSGSSLPNAATEGVVIVNDTDNEADKPSGPRRVGGFGDNNYGDPGAQPIGDIPWLMMALLVLGYALRVGKKYGHQLPDNGK